MGAGSQFAAELALISCTSEGGGWYSSTYWKRSEKSYQYACKNWKKCYTNATQLTRLWPSEEIPRHEKAKWTLSAPRLSLSFKNLDTQQLLWTCLSSSSRRVITKAAAFILRFLCCWIDCMVVIVEYFSRKWAEQEVACKPIYWGRCCGVE